MNISLIPDEVSHDPFTAIELGTRWGIRNYEIRYAYRWRVPFCPQWVTDRTIAAVQSTGVTVTGISPGLFKPIMQVDGTAIPVHADTPDEINRHIEIHLPRCFDLATRLKTQNIIVFALTKPTNVNTASIPSVVIDALGRAAAKAQQAGFNLLLENGAGTWADSGKATRALLDAVHSESLHLTWDAANVVYGNQSENPVTEGYPLVKSFVRNVHVKDAAVTGGKPHWMMLGDGVVDWKEQIRRLKKDGYSGPITLEPHLQYESPLGLVACIEEFARRAKILLA